jgi:surface polysaccharide O-acyltransferase-like enzyme
MNSTKRNHGIDLFKFGAMLYIVGYWHLFNYVDLFDNYNNIATNLFTRLCLGYFVLVSGYFASIKFQKTKIIKFYVTKILRIYPMYFAAVLLFYFLGINSLDKTITAATLIAMFYPPVPWTLWFITMMMVLYIITPVIIKSIGFFNVSSVHRIVVLLLPVIFVLLVYSYWSGYLDLRLVLYFIPFAYGILLGYNNTDIRQKKYLQTLLFVVSIFIAAFFYDDNK